MSWKKWALVFKPQQPVENVGDFMAWKECSYCKYIQQPFTGNYSTIFCPACGGKISTSVVGRWHTSSYRGQITATTFELPPKHFANNAPRIIKNKPLDKL